MNEGSSSFISFDCCCFNFISILFFVFVPCAHAALYKHCPYAGIESFANDVVLRSINTVAGILCCNTFARIRAIGKWRR